MINHSPGLWLTRLHFLIDWQHYLIFNFISRDWKKNILFDNKVKDIFLSINSDYKS